MKVGRYSSLEWTSLECWIRRAFFEVKMSSAYMHESDKGMSATNRLYIKLVALHEVAHFVIAKENGFIPKYIQIRMLYTARGNYNGHDGTTGMDCSECLDSKVSIFQYVKRRTMSVMAGKLAQILYFKAANLGDAMKCEVVNFGAIVDNNKITDLLMLLHNMKYSKSEDKLGNENAIKMYERRLESKVVGGLECYFGKMVDFAKKVADDFEGVDCASLEDEDGRYCGGVKFFEYSNGDIERFLSGSCI